jgi:hypothetical protein
MNEQEKHVQWVMQEGKKRGYHEFVKVIDGVLKSEGFEAAYKYIHINAEIQKMLFMSRGDDAMSA